jgi:MFS family permease
MADTEKQTLDKVSSDGSATGFDDLGFSLQEQKHIVKRIDRRLVTVVGVLYCISLMDRTNLSVANIAGMEFELGLDVGYRYSIATLTFFITYVIFQPPSTIIVRKLGPRVHLSAIVLLWGVVMIGMGFVNDWQTLAGLRAILGILEAGYFPSCVYLLSTWYVRYDMGRRYAVFYLLGCFASACSGILAYGLSQMEGVNGYLGWRWIFIIEGILTCLLGIAAYWLVVGFPDSVQKSWRFLSAKETQFIVNKVNADRGDANSEPFKLSRFLGAGADIKIWAFALLFFNTTTVTYALAFFLPLILVDGMGFDVGAAQCLVAPPYAFAAIVMVLTGWASDRFRLRGPGIVFNSILALIGLPIMGYADSVAVRYFGVFLVTAGVNSNIPLVMTYQANNIRGQWKRAFCSATLVGFGGIGGIAGSLVFRSQDAPGYHPGLYACIACCLLNLVLVGLLSLKFFRDNKKQAQGKLVIEGGEAGFRYTY